MRAHSLALLCLRCLFERSALFLGKDVQEGPEVKVVCGRNEAGDSSYSVFLQNDLLRKIGVRWKVVARQC